MIYIFDLDDFCDEHNVLPKLKELKVILPDLKVNLFTIPNKTSLNLLEKTAKEDWIHLIPHGLNHDDNYEFAKLTVEESDRKLTEIKYKQLYQKGFKAPGWQISLGVMAVLRRRKWWVAVQHSDWTMFEDVNGPYQPAVLERLDYYAWREVKEGYKAIHGHCHNVCGNGLEEIWDDLIKLPKDSQFIFINDYVEKNISM